MMNKIYFSGCGLSTRLGQGVEENVFKLFRLADGVETLSMPKLSFYVEDTIVDVPVHLLPRDEQQGDEQKFNQKILTQVVDEAIINAGLTKQQVSRLGLFVGSTSVDISCAEERIVATNCSDSELAKNIPDFTQFSEYLIEKYQIMGPTFSFHTACTSSANALIYAAEMVRRGDVEHALVMGIEFSNQMSTLGFSSLGLISSQGMRPFDKERDGLYLGEGCGAVILSNQPNSHGFGLEGAAYLGDHYNVSTCNPDGSTVAQVINDSLVRAGITSDQIAVVKTHGTASLSNDEAESAGLSLVFGKQPPYALVLKPYIGHTLGACGIIELILFYQSLVRKKRLPKVPTNITPDPEFNMRLYRHDERIESGYYLLNYFGFGGNNCTLIISNMESKN